jgi:hypothetical protein
VVAVPEEDLVRIVIEMIVKCLEEFYRLIMMRVTSPSLAQAGQASTPRRSQSDAS